MKIRSCGLRTLGLGQFFVCFSSSTSGFLKKAARLFCCEAPSIFFHFTKLHLAFHRHGVSFHFGVIFSFKGNPNDTKYNVLTVRCFQICGYSLGKAHSCFKPHKERSNRDSQSFSEFGVEVLDSTPCDLRALTFRMNLNAD